MVMDFDCSVRLAVQNGEDFKSNRELSLELANILWDQGSTPESKHETRESSRMLQSFASEKYWICASYPGTRSAESAGRALSLKHPALHIRLHLSPSHGNIEQRLFFENGKLVARQDVVEVWGPVESVE